MMYIIQNHPMKMCSTIHHARALLIILLSSSLRLKWKPAKKGIMTREGEKKATTFFNRHTFQCSTGSQRRFFPFFFLLIAKSLQLLLFQIFVVFRLRKQKNFLVFVMLLEISYSSMNRNAKSLKNFFSFSIVDFKTRKKNINFQPLFTFHSVVCFMSLSPVHSWNVYCYSLVFLLRLRHKIGTCELFFRCH